VHHALVDGVIMIKKKIIKLAVVGSRSFNNYSIMKQALTQRLPFVLVSGGAKGADSLAERFARENDLETIIHFPEWKKYGRKAGYLRNSFIVRDCDKLVAFWDGKSKGTKMTIDLAEKNGKPCSIIRF